MTPDSSSANAAITWTKNRPNGPRVSTVSSTDAKWTPRRISRCVARKSYRFRFNRSNFATTTAPTRTVRPCETIPSRTTAIIA